jgi:hypothetical protein
MNIAIYKSPTRREEWVVSSLANGFKRHGVNITVIPKPSNPVIPTGTDLVVFIGVKSRKIRDVCVRAGVPYLLIDKGYFQRWKYHRFALNGFTPCYLGSGFSDPTRFKNLKIKLGNVRHPSASRVVFVGFDNKYAAFHGLDDATEYATNVNAKLESIIYGTSLKLFTRNRSDRAAMPFSALLPTCYCVVVHGSIAGVEAIIGGVPVISLGGRAANVVHDLSNTTLESVINPQRPNEESVAKRLAELAWCQFTTEEIAQGLAWGTISDQYRRLGNR